jgi:hypothetical protein
VTLSAIKVCQSNSQATNKQTNKQTNRQTDKQTNKQTNTKRTNDMVQYPWLLTQSSMVVPQGNSNTAFHYVLSKIPPVLVYISGHMTAAV